MTLPTLPFDIEVSHQPPDPDMLDATCEACAQHGCVPLAQVSWTDRWDTEPTAMAVGSSCLPVVVDTARDRRAPDSSPTSVAVPAWTLHDLAVMLGTHSVVIAEWINAGWLTPEQPVVATAATRLLADQAHHARAIYRLAVKGVRPDAAHRLLSGSDEDQAVAEAILNAPALAPQPAVA